MWDKILKSVGLARYSSYQEASDMLHEKTAITYELRGRVFALEERVGKMSDVPILNEELGYMEEKYSKIKREMAKHGDV
jgi:hypothetical protein